MEKTKRMYSGGLFVRYMVVDDLKNPQYADPILFRTIEDVYDYTVEFFPAQDLSKMKIAKVIVLGDEIDIQETIKKKRK